MAKKASKPTAKASKKFNSVTNKKAVAKGKTGGKSPRGRSAVAATGVKTEARVLKTRIAESGKTSRIKGHVSTVTRKNQAKRDHKADDTSNKEIKKGLPSAAAQAKSSINIEVSTKGGCSAEFIADVTSTIGQSLARYEKRITRVEAYFEDVNGPKGGADHQCRLEARLAAMKPVSVSDKSSDTAQALKGAISKLDRLLKSTLGKSKDVKGKMSASGLST